MSVRRFFYRVLRITLFTGLIISLTGAVAAAFIQWYLLRELPSTENIKQVPMQVPFRVYTQDNKFIGEFGEQKRIPVALNHIPPLLVKAVLAAEDDRFFTHPGVDFKSLMRAFFNLVRTGEIQQGGSTITMQLARNFFLSPEKTYTRKIKEILLALKIEEELQKNEILELYMNKIFMGHRAYGVGAAAQVYYGKSLKELNLAECAMLAGIPKAPSANNPISNPSNAIDRRNYVLRRMLTLEYISQVEFDKASNLPDDAKITRLTPEIEAPYVAEMARLYLQERFGDDAYGRGYKVITTIDSRLQNAAQTALRNALFAYDERHGYRGGLDYIRNMPSKFDEKWANEVLAKYPTQGGMLPSLVLQAGGDVVAYNAQLGKFTISARDVAWARYNHRLRRKSGYSGDVVRRGEVIMVRSITRLITQKSSKDPTDEDNDDAGETVQLAAPRWRLAEVPQVEGAMVALRPDDAAILALAGGFDFYQSNFNRVTQAARQPGSSFKPFIYSAALENGFSPASVINDAPLVIRVGNVVWRPHNASNRFYGPTTLRQALTFSRNLVSIRLLMAVGLNRGIDYVTRFGFKKERIPHNLTIALGTADMMPLELVTGFAVFANGGYRVESHFIQRIEDMDGNVVFSANPLRVCRDKTCPPPVLQVKHADSKTGDTKKTGASPWLAIDPEDEPQGEVPRHAPLAIQPRSAWLMTSILKDVVRFGTAKAARKLGRDDIAGKTGTTNDQRDAWFTGYTPDIVATSWVGFDQPRSLGHSEYGGRAALPMWIEFMETALKGKPSRSLPEPSGLITARVDPETNSLTNKRNPNGIFETFFSDDVPKRKTPTVRQPRDNKNRGSGNEERSGSNRNSNSSSSSGDANSGRSAPPKRPKETVIPEQLF